MEEAAYHELCAYTLGHGAAAFIHQHVVDAHAAQSAVAETKAIALTFALVGLYLHLERGLSGREVQLVHMALARRKQAWPLFVLPEQRGAITAASVMEVPPGPDRDHRIDEWCSSVWSEFRECRPVLQDLLESNGVRVASRG
jgi:hypothetical protein